MLDISQPAEAVVNGLHHPFCDRDVPTYTKAAILEARGALHEPAFIRGVLCLP